MKSEGPRVAFNYSSSCGWRLGRMLAASAEKRVTSRLTLQLSRSFANKMGQVLQIITGGDTEATDKVLGCVLKVSVTVIDSRELILGPAEVGIAGDRGRAVEGLEPLLGFRLGIGVETVTAEELVR